MPKHWKEEDFEVLKTATTFAELAEVALSILKRMKDDGCEITELCGPMSTGGLGDMERNFDFFRFAIKRARDNGLTVFDQTPFQEVIQRFSNHLVHGEYNTDILDLFYKKIFESGLISRALFLPLWETSRGSRWEREFIGTLPIQIEEYPTLWLE